MRDLELYRLTPLFWFDHSLSNRKNLITSDNLVAVEDVLLWDFEAFDDEMHNIDLRVIKTIDVTESVMDDGPVWALPVAAEETLAERPGPGPVRGSMINRLIKRGSKGRSNFSSGLGFLRGDN